MRRDRMERPTGDGEEPLGSEDRGRSWTGSAGASVIREGQAAAGALL